jgi:4-diphosphocytidyl-2-C-methyl-D-erythritol kinase
VTLRAPAKLNIRLRVLGRGEDGYHSIETLFLRLGLADEVTIVQNYTGLELETSGIGDLGDGEENLCWRAADIFFKAIRCNPNVSIRLVKHIPIAAGLGGGSSDAATVLLGLNRIHDRPLDLAELMGLAGELGSDIPFFVSETPFALAWERGERLLPLEPPRSRPVLIVVPEFGVKAGDAYSWLSADAAGGISTSGVGPGRLPAPTELANWDVLSTLAQNDLAIPVYRRHPELLVAADSLSSSEAEIALLCGSGACVAGVFPTATQRDTAADRLQADQIIPAEWHLIATWSDGPGAPEAAG